MSSQSHPISDKLLSLTSSKLASLENGQLHLNEAFLSNLIKTHQQQPYPWHEIPITILSILGTPSDEKYVLTRSLIEFFESPLDIRAKTSFYFDNTPQSSSAEFATTALYIINKPYFFQLEDGSHSVLWIVNLRQSDGGKDNIGPLQQLLLLISSRIIEVKFDKDNFRLLKQLQMLIEQRDGFERVPHLCDSFAYLFLSLGEPFYPNKILPFYKAEQARQKLFDRVNATTGYAEAASIAFQLRDASLIKMKNITGPLYSGYSCRDKHQEVIMLETLYNSMTNLHQASRPWPKIDYEGRKIYLGSLLGFLKDSTAYVNSLNGVHPTPPLRTHSKTAQHGNLPQTHTSSVPPPTIPTSAAAAHQGGTRPVQASEQPGRISRSTSKDSSDNKEKNVSNLEQNMSSLTLDQSSNNPRECGEPEIINNETTKEKLTKKILLYYNKEMKRFLVEDVYPPKVFQSIHESLKTHFAGEYKCIFDVNEEQLNELVPVLTTSLDEAFSQHCRKNTQNLKNKQENISKCLQKVISSYMERIEKILRQNPNGLEESNLGREHNSIITELQNILGAEIKKIREAEPLEGHEMSFIAEVREYWEESVLERNKENLIAWEEARSKMSGESEPQSTQTEQPSALTRTKVLDDEDTKFQPQAAPENIPVSEPQLWQSLGKEAETTLQAARKELSSKTQAIHEQLKATSLHFKSSSQREQFIKMWQVAASCAKDQNSTLEQIRKQIGIINSWFPSAKSTAL